MYEHEIKKLILCKLLSLEDNDSIFLNEFAVNLVRADIAVFNNKIHLIEIKSARDSLQRLEKQLNYFSLYSEKCTLVIHAKHYKKAIKTVPKFIGLWIVKNEEIIVDRLAKKRDIEAIFLSEFWWSQELKLLLGRVLPKASKLPVEALRKAFIELVSYDKICKWTKENLKIKFRKRSLKVIEAVKKNIPFPKWEMPDINKKYLLKLRQKLLQDGVQKKASSLTWDCRERRWINKR